MKYLYKMICTAFICTLTFIVPINGKTECTEKSIRELAVNKAKQFYPNKTIGKVRIFDNYNDKYELTYYYIVIETNNNGEIIRLKCYPNYTCSKPFTVKIDPNVLYE